MRRAARRATPGRAGPPRGRRSSRLPLPPTRPVHVEHPLPHVAGHVVEAERIRAEPPHWCEQRIAVGGERGARAPREVGGRRGADGAVREALHEARVEHVAEHGRLAAGVPPGAVDRAGHEAVLAPRAGRVGPLSLGRQPPPGRPAVPPHAPGGLAPRHVGVGGRSPLDLAQAVGEADRLAPGDADHRQICAEKRAPPDLGARPRRPAGGGVAALEHRVAAHHRLPQRLGDLGAPEREAPRERHVVGRQLVGVAVGLVVERPPEKGLAGDLHRDVAVLGGRAPPGAGRHRPLQRRPAGGDAHPRGGRPGAVPGPVVARGTDLVGPGPKPREPPVGADPLQAVGGHEPDAPHHRARSVGDHLDGPVSSERAPQAREHEAADHERRRPAQARPGTRSRRRDVPRACSGERTAHPGERLREVPGVRRSLPRPRRQRERERLLQRLDQQRAARARPRVAVERGPREPLGECSLEILAILGQHGLQAVDVDERLERQRAQGRPPIGPIGILVRRGGGLHELAPLRRELPVAVGHRLERAPGDQPEHGHGGGVDVPRGIQLLGAVGQDLVDGRVALGVGARHEAGGKIRRRPSKVARSTTGTTWSRRSG